MQQRTITTHLDKYGRCCAIERQRAGETVLLAGSLENAVSHKEIPEPYISLAMREISNTVSSQGVTVVVGKEVVTL